MILPSKILSSIGVAITIPMKKAISIRGNPLLNSGHDILAFPSENIELTRYLSKLKITNPQIIPEKIAAIKLSKTVKAAYPPEKEARIAVPKMVPPMPVFFAQSTGHIRKSSLSSPPQVHKNSFRKPTLLVLPSSRNFVISSRVF